MASRFSFYSFPGYELLILRIQLLISTIKFFDIKNLIVDINIAIVLSLQYMGVMTLRRTYF